MNSSKKSYSHQGQDLILRDLFRNKTGGIFVDIGCNHPIIESNTYLLYKMGWSGFGIDGESLFAKEWLKYRDRDCFINAVVDRDTGKATFYKFPNHTMSTSDKQTMEAYTEKHGQPDDTILVETIPVEDILIEYKVPGEFELLCCDVEGKDLEAIKSVNFKKFRPKVILVEIKLFNFYKPKDSDTVNFLYDNNYIMIAKTPLDGFFVNRNEDLGWIPQSMLNT